MSVFFFYLVDLPIQIVTIVGYIKLNLLLNIELNWNRLSLNGIHLKSNYCWALFFLLFYSKVNFRWKSFPICSLMVLVIILQYFILSCTENDVTKSINKRNGWWFQINVDFLFHSWWHIKFVVPIFYYDIKCNATHSWRYKKKQQQTNISCWCLCLCFGSALTISDHKEKEESKYKMKSITLCKCMRSESTFCEHIFDYTFGFITTHYGLYQRLNTQKSVHNSGHWDTGTIRALHVSWQYIWRHFSCVWLRIYLHGKYKLCPARIEYWIINDGHILIRLASADRVRVKITLAFIAYRYGWQPKKRSFPIDESVQL